MALQERGTRSSSINDKQEQNYNRVITIVFLALFIDLLGFALILPLFPSILDYYSQTEVSNRESQPTESVRILREEWKKNHLPWGKPNSCRKINNYPAHMNGSWTEFNCEPE